MEFKCFSMNSWTVVSLLCGLAWRLAAGESPYEVPQDYIHEPNLHCAFEDGLLCMWKDVSTSDKLKWKAYNKPDYSYAQSSGPQKDHTTGHGYFLSMKTSFRYDAGSALLESVSVATNNETCLTFWYFMYGTRVEGLNVYKIGDEDQKDEVFSMFGFQGNRWYKAVIDTGSGTFKLQIEATFVGRKDYGNIAIDDITFSYEDCPETDSTLLEDQPRFDCDFEHDFCSWVYSDSTSLSWHIRNVPSDSNDRNALPPESKGTSYAEVVKKFRSYNFENMLKSPTITLDSESCFSFWYKMNGTEVHRFSAKSFQYGQSYYGGNIIFFTDFDSGPVWIHTSVTLPAGNNTHIAFIASGRRHGDGTFGLDDVRLTRGRACIEDHESVINCDFEKDFCKWYMQTKKDEGDWLRTKDPTPTNSTGPSYDHTTGDGYYIFLDASDVQEANLYSTPFSVNYSGACLSFWYYMHGPDVNTLVLRSKGNSYDYSGINWSKKGPQGDHWIPEKISLTSNYGTEKILLIFTAKRSYFPRGDIALDDISITFGAPCKSDIDKETIVPTTIFPEISRVETVTEPTVTTTTTTTTGLPPLETPELLVIGKINPAYNNSRVELICQTSEENDYRVRKLWYKANENWSSYEKDRVQNVWGKSLVFEEIHPKDAGFYSCVLERYYRDASNASNEVEIRVVPDPRPSPLLKVSSSGSDVFFEKDSIDVLADAVVKLECGDEIDGGEYHWKTTSNAFNSFNLPKDRVLVLNGTQPKHSGIYSCRITKDEFMTAKSNELNIPVRQGKRCDRDWKCYGDNYYRNCVDKRCECQKDAVLRGRECRGRPATPNITTSPPFLEFGIGESFYLICEANEPAPANLTYTFIKQYSYTKAPSIMKITNATEDDTGYYSCRVKYDDIDSKASRNIHIQIKDFVDLNCDFTKDFCEWFQKNETATANFTTASSDDHGENSGPRGPFIQLDASDTKVPERAILLSSTIDRMALDSCLTFWYRMHGPDVHSLSVWRYTYSDETRIFGGNKLWTVIGEKGDVWHKQTVTIGAGSKFYVAFDAIGQVAIDDITFTYRGGC